jgi:hypothetical protein
MIRGDGSVSHGWLFRKRCLFFLYSAVFAHVLHVSPRTLEKQEQGRAKPKEQPATLIILVLLSCPGKGASPLQKLSPFWSGDTEVLITTAI